LKRSFNKDTKQVLYIVVQCTQVKKQDNNCIIAKKKIKNYNILVIQELYIGDSLLGSDFRSGSDLLRSY